VTAPGYEPLVAAQERIIAQLQDRLAEQDRRLAAGAAAGRLLAQLLSAAVE
jgi:uncharacterized coiled-coil protein SlyX